MRILIVSQYFLPQPLANAEVVGGLAGDLARLGHEVVVVSPVRDAEPPEGVIHVRGWGWFAPDRASVGQRLLEYVSFSLGALAGGARGARPDVIVVPSPPPTLGIIGLVIGRLRRTPVVYNVQDLYPEVAQAVSTTPSTVVSLLRRLLRVVYRGSAAVVVIDPAFETAIERAEPRAAVHSIRNGIDRSPFRQARRDDAFLAELGIPEGAQVVMYAGNVGRSQDLGAVVRATADTGAHLVIHGAGARLDELQRAVGDAPHVHYSGFRQRDELGRVFGSADLHVVPLKPGVAWSSVPSKLLSIFAAGRPAVVAAEKGSPAAGLIVESSGGWVIEPGDENALRTATVEALLDAGELRARGALAREWADAHAGTERAAREWEALLRDVSGGRR
jgi:colanic acid biosynthesis glycosyl transferase WcaI